MGLSESPKRLIFDFYVESCLWNDDWEELNPTTSVCDSGIIEEALIPLRFPNIWELFFIGETFDSYY